MKAARTWVLVADAAHAKLYETAGPNQGLTALPDIDLKEPIPPTRELGSDRPGRSHDSHGQGRHAMAARADWHDQAKEDFAKSLAKKLNQAQKTQSFDRLILAAPPKMLGVLRSQLSSQTAKLVIAELDRDLVKLDERALLKELSEVTAL